MDIKLKSNLKIVLWYLLFTFGLSGIIYGMSQGNEFYNKNYFSSMYFESRLSHYLQHLTSFEFNNMDISEAKKNLKVTKEEIVEHRYKYGDLSTQIANIKTQYEPKIQDALKANKQEVVDTFIAERDALIEDITLNFKSDEHVQAKIIKEKEEKIDAYYSQLEGYRGEFESYNFVFRYYLKDTLSGQVYTNLDLTGSNSVNKVKEQLIYSRDYNNLSTGQYDYIIVPDNETYKLIAKKTGGFEGWIGVDKAAFASSFMFKEYNEFKKRQTVFYIYYITSFIALISSFYLNIRWGVGKISIAEKLKYYYYKIPLELRFMLFIFTGMLALWCMFFTIDGLSYHQEQNGYYLGRAFLFLVNLAIAATFVAITGIQGSLNYQRVKEGNLKLELRNSIIYRSLRAIKEAFLVRSLGFKIMLLLGIIFAAGFGFLVVLTHPTAIVIYAPLFLMVVVPTLVILVKSIGYFNRIFNYTNKLAKGEFEPDLIVKEKSILGNLASSINQLKHGVKTSQREQAKSERLKTELITNVSHDLRTPLTSIITYTELLRSPDLPAADREAYIQIIDRKSKRLKVLIDDLFEASKMASGNVELKKEKVDILQLLQQALAEHDEAIKASNLQFRLTKPEEAVYAVVDGQKIWRVFDNLIGNILKYSLEGTRAYIIVRVTQEKLIIAFKNVTKYELGEDIDELFERFKRGDESRHTEGSGLGLAIAKSIIDLHEGTLDIEVDGDLFKVTISLDTLK